MSKELIALISTADKTPEQVSKEAWEAFVHYRATKRGLKKCKVCGEYKGFITKKGEIIGATCICDGILCTTCKVTKMRRPVSNVYYEDTDEFWHTPWFLHTCSKCNNK
jgi:ribosomal protein S14